MLAPGVNARETADCETRARAATSNEVAREAVRFAPSVLSDMLSVSRGERRAPHDRTEAGAENAPVLSPIVLTRRRRCAIIECVFKPPRKLFGRVRRAV